MRSQKPVGWRGESYRHYLASKGVRTHSARVYRVKIIDVQEKLNAKSRMNVAEAAREGSMDHELFDPLRFAKFMQMRFPPGEEQKLITGEVTSRYTSENYAEEWKDRFLKGRAWNEGDAEARAVLKEVYPEIYGNWGISRNEYVQPKKYEYVFRTLPSGYREIVDMNPVPPEGLERTPDFSSYYDMVEYVVSKGGVYEGYTEFPGKYGTKFVGYYAPAGVVEK